MLKDLKVNVSKDNEPVISKSNIEALPASIVAEHIDIMEHRKQTHTSKYVSYCLAIGRLYLHTLNDKHTAKVYFARCSAGINARVSRNTQH